MQVPLGSLGTGVTSSCELPHMGARKRSAGAVCVPQGHGICAAPNTGLCASCALNMHPTTQPQLQLQKQPVLTYTCCGLQDKQLPKVCDSE